MLDKETILLGLKQLNSDFKNTKKTTRIQLLKKKFEVVS